MKDGWTIGYGAIVLACVAFGAFVKVARATDWAFAAFVALVSAAVAVCALNWIHAILGKIDDEPRSASRARHD